MCAVIANLVLAPETGCDGIFPWTSAGRSKSEQPGGTRQRRCTGLDLSFDVSRNAEEIRGLELWQVRAKPCSGILVVRRTIWSQDSGQHHGMQGLSKPGLQATGPDGLHVPDVHACFRLTWLSLACDAQIFEGWKVEKAPVSHLLRFDVNHLRRVLDSVRGRTHVSV